jgi:S-adenosylmethionine hydrolase
VTRMCSNYAEGGPGEAFGILGSMGFVEIATNRGSAFQLLGVGKGTDVNLVLEG